MPGGPAIQQNVNIKSEQVKVPPTPIGKLPQAPIMAPPNLPLSSDKYGVLTIKVMRGTDLKTSGFMGKADPYVKLKIGDQEMTTNVHNNGGKKPVWGDSFDFKVLNEKEMELQVYDKETVGQDKLIGSTKVVILDWISRGSFDGDIEISDVNDQMAGKVTLAVKFQRPNHKTPGPPMSPPGPPKDVPGPGPPGGAKAQQKAEEPRDPNGSFTDQEIKEAFEAFDLDNNHFVGAAEIKHVLINIGEQVTDTEVDEMIRMVDVDGDGQVSFAEFYEMVTGGRKPPAGLYDGPGKSRLCQKVVPNLLLFVGGGSKNAPPPPPGGTSSRPQGGASAAIAERNARKAALEGFAKQNNIKPESIKKAFKRFQAVDKDSSGMVDYTEFCEIMQVDPSPQVEKLFQLFDKSKSGQIEVREFMIGLANFSGASKDEKLKFAFMIFDEDGNGVITKQELIKILKANHMAGASQEVQRKADTIMAQADKDGDGVVSFDEFVVVSKKFPNILWPRT